MMFTQEPDQGSQAGGARQHSPVAATACCSVQALAAGLPDRDRTDRIAVEAPLEIRIGGKPVTVVMRTPGDDEELVRGLLFSEGIITSLPDIKAIARPVGAQERDSIIAVELATCRRQAARDVGGDRLFYSSSSCGVCGKRTLAALRVQGQVCDSPVRVDRDVLAALPERLQAAQPTFALTGGVHASALFTADGGLIAVREDVGRHNALDKLIGWALAAGRMPLSECVLLVSGRVSYELLQKSIAAGVPVIAAVGAPSSLAVELAQTFGITLIGFLRPATMNVYTCPERVATQA